jgi:hypothetical protein
MSIEKALVGFVFVILLCVVEGFAFAEEVPFTLDDRERLIRLEVGLEEIDKRFEQIDKRFEQIDKRFEELITFMWMFVVIFIGVTGVTIGFALWDRRTMVRPFEVRV